MRNVINIITLLCLCACGGSGGGGGVDLPPGRDVVTPAFESYPRSGANDPFRGFNRVRRDNSTDADTAVLAQFQDADPADPAGYRNLIALSDETYDGKVIIEVIAEVESAGGTETVKRILRLTADQAPFDNEQGGNMIADVDQKYYLRGQNFVWVSINGEPIRSGVDTGGLVDLVLDFGTETASINLRTGENATSAIRTEILAEGLAFNVQSGAYGGDITVQVWDPASTTIFAIDGSLRGTIGGTPAFANDTHGMTTSGLYTATGTDGGTTVVLDGVFVGTDPNALP